MPPLNAHADVSSMPRGLNFGLNLNLHPCFMYASSKVSGMTARMCRLVGALAVRLCDKYLNLMCSLNYLGKVHSGYRGVTC